MSHPHKRFYVERDPDRSRDSATEKTVVAYGTWLADSGDFLMEWERDAFEEDERAEGAVESRYKSIEDAEQASGGTVVFEDYPPGDWFTAIQSPEVAVEARGPVSFPVPTDEGMAEEGDYILKDEDGETYPCDPDTFENRYMKPEASDR